MWHIREPADKNKVEEMGMRVRHDPAQWSGTMVKVMLGFGSLGALLLLWAIISLMRGT